MYKLGAKLRIPALSPSSTATTLSEDSIIKDAPYDNSDGLAYPMTPPTSEQLSANQNVNYSTENDPL